MDIGDACMLTLLLDFLEVACEKPLEVRDLQLLNQALH